MKYGGIIETMYSQFSEGEIPEEIKKYKERIDSLFLVNSFDELKTKLETFNEKERNYLSCTYLDELYKVYLDKYPLNCAISNNTSFDVINLLFEVIKREKINELNNNIMKSKEIDGAFFIASNRGNLEVVKKLIKSVNYTENLLALKEASINGHLEVVKFITYETKAKWDKCLVLASERGHFQIVKFLIENGADVHTENDDALRSAAGRGHLSVVKLLLENGADVHAKNNDSLFTAAMRGHFDVVKILLEKGADVHAQHDDSIATASENGHFDVVKILLENGANVHAQIDYALRCASLNGHLNIVNLLIESGANVHAENNQALKWASYQGHLEIVKRLKEAGSVLP